MVYAYKASHKARGGGGCSEAGCAGVVASKRQAVQVRQSTRHGEKAGAISWHASAGENKGRQRQGRERRCGSLQGGRRSRK
jgi:hypothetical protein